MLSDPFAAAELLEAGALLICFITEITREARVVKSTEREDDAPFVLLMKAFFQLCFLSVRGIRFSPHHGRTCRSLEEVRLARLPCGV